MYRLKSAVIGMGLVLVAAALICAIWFAAIRVIAGPDSDAKTEKKEVLIEKAFENIKISEVSSDVVLRASGDGKVRVEYYDTKNTVHEIGVEGNTQIGRAHV